MTELVALIAWSVVAAGYLSVAVIVFVFQVLHLAKDFPIRKTWAAITGILWPISLSIFLLARRKARK